MMPLGSTIGIPPNRDRVGGEMRDGKILIPIEGAAGRGELPRGSRRRQPNGSGSR